MTAIKAAKIILFTLAGLILLITATVYGNLYLSLPELNQTLSTEQISRPGSIQRDHLGTAVIKADNRLDASFFLGFAHGQDRFFQMDLLRRNSAGELSELFGQAAIELDKKQRFHQFRKRATKIFNALPETEQQQLKSYTAGVNLALSQFSIQPFEYQLLGSQPRQWIPEDSLLVIFSMYLDLQTVTIEQDLALTKIEQQFGTQIRQFITQPSPYQAALDGTELPLSNSEIPDLNTDMAGSASINLEQRLDLTRISDPMVMGSNNWAVTGQLTESGHAMLSDDMHLGLAVPTTWYRTQLNYSHPPALESSESARLIQVTGLSLPGAPAVVVGSNAHIAWGFTNSYIDTADWIELSEKSKTRIETEVIDVANAEQETLELEISDFGPIRSLSGKKYALSWVAHQPFAVDLQLISMEQFTQVEQALQLAPDVGIPAQNLMVVGKNGEAAWSIIGALSARSLHSNVALSESSVSLNDRTRVNEQFADITDPEHHRLWTGNSRVVGGQSLQHLGAGGYALGARSLQIKQGLFAKQAFDENDFYQLQLDNKAVFLQRWQHLLLSHLKSANAEEFSQDIKMLESWGACACSDSVGYTLVRKFRNALISTVFAPLEDSLQAEHLSLKSVSRSLEPAIWKLVNEFPDSWLNDTFTSWPELIVEVYRAERRRLLKQHSGRVNGSLNSLTWGEVNAFTIQHPFSKQMPFLSFLLDMPVESGWGDSYMPAVQRIASGASQRLVVQPGLEESGILTLPGGQSGHPLSPFYRKGFSDFVENRHTPLLPGESIYKIDFKVE